MWEDDSSRWMILFQQFWLSPTLYKLGKKHRNANALSRATQEDDPSVSTIQFSDKLKSTCSAQSQHVKLSKVMEVLKVGGDLQDSNINALAGIFPKSGFPKMIEGDNDM